jgi:hypothetical protein
MISDFERQYLEEVYSKLLLLQRRVYNYDIDTILDSLEIILEEQRSKEI